MTGHVRPHYIYYSRLGHEAFSTAVTMTLRCLECASCIHCYLANICPSFLRQTSLFTIIFISKLGSPIHTESISFFDIRHSRMYSTLVCTHRESKNHRHPRQENQLPNISLADQSPTAIDSPASHIQYATKVVLCTKLLIMHCRDPPNGGR